MFDSLSDKLSGILDRLTRRGALTEADVDAALREVRRALLEADVALDVVRAFVDKVKSRAVGIEVIKSVTPGQMVVKIVHDQQVGVDCLPVVAGQQPAQIAQRALQAGRLGGYDAVILDTAGRTTLDEAMMAEVAEVKRAADPHEVLLVADALTGQDAVNLARAFNERVGLTGIVLTRVDGDGRGGAALSMRAVTGKPIKLIGTGEKLDAIEDFDPARIAGRILGMGDIVALLEKAAATIDAEKAARVAEKIRKGAFDLSDMREQLEQMQKIGGMSGLLGMMPGIAKMKNQLAGANLDERVLKRQTAIIDSMTPKERRNPDVLKASRKKRIAAGSGTRDEDVNRLLKMHRQMADMMKAMGKRGGLGRLGSMIGMGGG